MLLCLGSAGVDDAAVRRAAHLPALPFGIPQRPAVQPELVSASDLRPAAGGLLWHGLGDGG